MACLYKRGEDVRRHGFLQAPWSIKWRDLDGRERRIRVGRWKDVAIQRLAQIERELALGAVGLTDLFTQHRRRPIVEHLDAFALALESGSLRSRRGIGLPTLAYVKQSRTRLERAMAGMGIRVLGDGRHADRAERYLAQLLRDGAAAKTRDDIAITIRQFGSWLVRSGRLPTNPWASLCRIAGEADVTRERRALTLDELERLCAAAVERPVHMYRLAHPHADQQEPERLAELRRTGERYALLYRFAAFTGLRRNECRQIRWGDLDLDGEVPCVLVRAPVAKNRRAAHVPIVPQLVELLQAERARVQPGLADPVFIVPSAVAIRVRLDAEFAGIRRRNELGQVVDFHALRVTCATMLARAGVAPQLAQRILRHSDIKLTMKHYTKLGIEDLALAVAKLPVLGGGQQQSDAAITAGGEA
jgi:integrase